jgi:hypothetical protein
MADLYLRQKVFTKAFLVETFSISIKGVIANSYLVHPLSTDNMDISI